MKWNNYATHKPPESGLYLVNLILKKNDTEPDNIFLYVARYHTAFGQWYKHNPFDNSGDEPEKIRNRIISWASEIEDYIG